ncbi:PTS mannose/fructose/sorbose transporter subunit IIB [bacterium]|nr:MAG: PTS mannose/fructose/sorbose transporter subunit IIB [bacterium]
MFNVIGRVDNRLVHGQVLEGWVPRLKIDLILVCDEGLCKDPFQKSIFESLGFRGPDIMVISPAAAPASVEKNKNKKILILFRSTKGALDALKAGLDLTSLNLGNIHSSDECQRITESVYLNLATVVELSEIAGLGVEIEARALPGDKPIRITGEMLEEYKKNCPR